MPLIKTYLDPVNGFTQKCEVIMWVSVCIIRAHMLKVVVLEALSILTRVLNELPCLVKKNFRSLKVLY